MWLRAAGIDGINASFGPRFSDTDLTITSAIEGLGVALVSTVLVERDIAAGRLVVPFDISLESEFCYYVVSTRQAAQRAPVRAFRAWVLEQTNTEPAP